MRKKSTCAPLLDGNAVPMRKPGNPRPPGNATPQGAIALDAILADIATGEPAYNAVLAHGITMGTFWRWLSLDSELMEKYARAKQVGLERYSEDLMQIADDLTIPPEHKRIMVDSRKWLLSKLLTSKYGGRVAIQPRDDGDALLTALRLGRERSLIDP